MDLHKLISEKRLSIAGVWAALTNSYLVGFFRGKIYKGGLKQLCVPGLNCYSCPGALGSCPIGAFQSASAANGSISAYVTGTLLLFGVVFGRFICGYLCPFGWFQELLHKIPTRKFKVNKFFHKFTYLKYVILVLFVVAMPLLLRGSYNVGNPAFCEYICPAGTLTAGLPLLAANEGLRAGLGWLFALKFSILVAVIVGCIFVFRFFCRFLCPLGAFYGLFNGIALVKYEVVQTKCTRCAQCAKVCPVQVELYKKPHDSECIRCGKCKNICPTNAIVLDYIGKRGTCSKPTLDFPDSEH